MLPDPPLMPDTAVDNSRVTRTAPAMGAALFGPVALTILYLVVADLLRDLTGATGYARANLDRDTYAAYVLMLVAYVIVGTWKCRGENLRALFACVSIVACLFNMFLAFFGQMAP